MPQPLRLSVPQPCSESWAAMTPAAQGRHCAACAKVVIDFTTLSDAEVVALLHRTAAPCGRFREDQLQRVLWPLAEPAPRWRTWLAAAAAVLGLRELAAEQSVGQQKAAMQGNTPMPGHQKTGHQQPLFAAAEALAKQNTVRGRVIDQATGARLPGVTVLLRGTTVGVSTNFDGSFELAVPLTYQQDTTAVVSFHSIGYETQAVSLQQLRHRNVSVGMKTDDYMLSGIVVVDGYATRQLKPWHPQALWNRLRNAFRR
ncbi:carboxypeptidase-like regulatory domain-containing protein [Hymenobacter sp. APR13]|uniref:carboxypeptidase-like regulatory domain-containing protein n=1 Tax=Hymenobacter sp. APR13 TaxID=1356852 RepID=UPI0004E080E8|nr:carboxypeptidase-like regulatory domain-containing protein [Hymenobacter sp. APR13]AII51854.1 hypothetical protein N008_07635 [Hymenobacter sp. APR13]